MVNVRGKLTTALLVAQVIFVLLFGLFVDYGPSAGGSGKNHSDGHENVDLELYYPMFQDVHVMMLIGFGFLMTFLKRHGFGSVGFNFLLTCFVIEWATLVNGWFGFITSGMTTIYLNILTLLEADFAVATILISFGAVLGKASPVQLVVMSIFEVVFYNLNYWIGVKLLETIDVGGSLFIHTFGAYFGLAVARALYKKSQTNSNKEGSVYHSDVFAMIGTLFLWLYWPSFNAGPALGNERHRAVINTVLSLSACTVTTFALSAIVDKRNKLDMVHIQNATLAGGVAMGASANLMVHPFGALVVGCCAGVLSVIGYRYIQPVLTRAAKIHDTCGVHNLHGMPGILGAIISAIVCAIASKERYADSYDTLFVARDASQQAGYQMLALVITLALAISSGALTGFLLKLKAFDNLTWEEYYEDDVFWQVEDEDNSKDEKQVQEMNEIVEKASSASSEEMKALKDDME